MEIGKGRLSLLTFNRYGKCTTVARMSTSDSKTAAITNSIKHILREAGTPQCSIWVGQRGKEEFSTTVHLYPPVNTECDDERRSEDQLYNIGSLTKMFVAYALVILVERLATSDNPKHERFRCFRDAWSKGVNKYLDIDLHRKATTIDNLLSHFNGLPSMNDFIFGPDGTVLITLEEFPEIAQHVCWEVYRNSERSLQWQYSNGNYILAGMLIETFSGTSVPTFLEENIFRPYNMRRTCVSRDAFDKLQPWDVALPHIVSTDLIARGIEYPRYFGTPAFAAMGIYSCTRDLATFFSTLFNTLAKDTAVPDPDVEVVKHFLHPVVDLKEKGSYCFCGQHIDLCTSEAGSASLNRLTPTAQRKSSTYTLGTGPGGVPLEAIYGAGIVTGYECCFYLMPKIESFVIVLSNATGLVDASDHVSRLLLQELFDLKYTPSRTRRLAGGTKVKKVDPIDIITKARLGAHERRQFMEDTALRNGPKTQLRAMRELVGVYKNEKCHQDIMISCGVDGILQMQICGTASRSRPFELGLIDKRTLTVLETPQRGSSLLSVDVLADWKSLDIIMERDQTGSVISLARSRGSFTVVYARCDD